MFAQRARKTEKINEVVVASERAGEYGVGRAEQRGGRARERERERERGEELSLSLSALSLVLFVISRGMLSGAAAVNL